METGNHTDTQTVLGDLVFKEDGFYSLFENMYIYIYKNAYGDIRVVIASTTKLKLSHSNQSESDVFRFVIFLY